MHEKDSEALVKRANHIEDNSLIRNRQKPRKTIDKSLRFGNKWAIL